MHRIILFFFFGVFTSQALFSQNITTAIVEDIFRSDSVEGCFVSYDIQNGEVYIHNPERARSGFLPASTYKILNSLIALQTGIASDENFEIPYSGKPQIRKECNCTMDMTTAFKLSCLPYYQEIARRIGYDTMVAYVHKVQYGVMDIKKSNIDDFWIKGGSRITPLQQLDFMRRLATGSLPFNNNVMAVLKKMMLIESKKNYRLFGKTGLAFQDGKSIGWLVGYIETNEKSTAFVLNIEKRGDADDSFMKLRKDLVDRIIQKSGLE